MYRILLIVLGIIFTGCISSKKPATVNFNFIKKFPLKNNFKVVDKGYLLRNFNDLKLMFPSSLKDSISSKEADLLVSFFPVKQIRINTQNTLTDLCRNEDSREPIDISYEIKGSVEYLYIYEIKPKNKYRKICP